MHFLPSRAKWEKFNQTEKPESLKTEPGETEPVKAEFGKAWSRMAGNTESRKTEYVKIQSGKADQE
jgi:hypothetical protein